MTINEVIAYLEMCIEDGSKNPEDGVVFLDPERDWGGRVNYIDYDFEDKWFNVDTEEVGSQWHGPRSKLGACHTLRSVLWLLKCVVRDYRLDLDGEEPFCMVEHTFAGPKAVEVSSFELDPHNLYFLLTLGEPVKRKVYPVEAREEQ